MRSLGAGQDERGAYKSHHGYERVTSKPMANIEGSPVAYAGGGGGGNTRAFTWDWNPSLVCVPSQNGLLLLPPQRHRETYSRPGVLNAAPLASHNSISPSMRNGPLSLTVIFPGMLISPR